MARSELVALNSAMDAPAFKAAKFKYPADLNPSTQPWVHFEVREAVAVTNNVLTNFVMYMPPTLKTNYRGKWEDVELTYRQLSDAATDILDITNLGTRLGRAGNKILGSITGTNKLAQAEIENGVMVNPHAALQFKGMQFREFQMEFHMMARNADESGQIQSIIDKFRYHMHPDVEAGAGSVGAKFFLYPDHFNIQLFSPSDKYLFKFYSCVLENMEVDYAGSSVPSFFTSTGAPVDIRMNLQFKELSVLTKADFESDGTQKNRPIGSAS
jgi:hypothetical protein